MYGLAFDLRDAVRSLGSDLEVLIEPTIEMEPLSAPEPDIVLTSAARAEGLVPFESVALIVEVSDSSLQHDLHRKADLYSRFGIPEYWIVDIRALAIHQLWNPGPGGYSESRNVLFGSEIVSTTLPNLRVSTADLS